MGGTLGVAAGKGGNLYTPTERLKQAQEQGGAEQDQIKLQETGPATQNYEETPSIPQPPPWRPPSLFPLCQFCHAQLLQNSLQLVHEKDEYKRLCQLQEDEKKIHCLTEEINYIRRHIIEEKDKEIHSLHYQLQNCVQQNYALNEKVKEVQENCRDLSLKIEMVEHLHSQQSKADSGSYQDSGATPPLLQVAADSINGAITAFASDLFSRIQKSSLPKNFLGMNLNSKDITSGQMIKVAFRSFLCHALFKGFEDPFFSTSDGSPPFVKPASRKTQLLAVYKRCRDMDAKQMLNEETEFAHFFGVKECELRTQLKEQLLTSTEDVQKTEEVITSELCSRNNKLLRL